MIPGVAGGEIAGDHRRDDAVHGVAVLPGQTGGYGQRRRDGIHQLLGEAVPGNLGDLLIHDGLEGLGVSGIDVGCREHYGVLRTAHFDVGAEAAVGQHLLEPLLVIGRAGYEQVGHRVQRQLVLQVLSETRADNGVHDHRGVLGIRALLHREGQRLHHRLGDGGISRVIADGFPLLVGGEVAVQQLQKGLVVLELSVDVGGAVGGVVVFVVIVLQRLPGHVGDEFRVAAGFVADLRAGEGGAQQVDRRLPLEGRSAQHF